MPKVGGPLDVYNNRVINVGAPFATTDAVTKSYCDTKNPPMVYVSGGVLLQPSFSASPKFCSTGTLFLCPVYVPKALTITGYSIDVTSAASGGTAQIALYSSNANGIPSTLTANSTVSVSTAVTGNVSATLATPLALTAGLYWTGLITAGSATPYLMGQFTGLIPATTVGSGNANGNDFFQASATSFPTTISSSSISAFQGAPRVGLNLQ